MGTTTASPRWGAAALAWASLLWVGGCALRGAGRDATLELPPLPAAWQARFPSLSCRLLVAGAGGGVREHRVMGWPATATLRVPRDRPVPVVAVPMHAGAELKPAGCVLEDSSACLSWDQGPLASALLSLAAAGWDLSCLNARRLCDEVADLGLEDPWLLDTGHLVTRIAAGDLRAADVRALATTEVGLDLPAGDWIPDSAAGSVVSGGQHVVVALPTGFRSYFHAALPLVAEVYMDGRAAVVRLASHPF